MFDLTDKNALVTGASGGIGGAIARALHAAGARVGLSGTRAGALDALAGELRVMAGWLGLDTVTVERRGPFARELAAAVRHQG